VTVRLLGVSADDYVPHPIHAGNRIWIETNCYADLWIEILHSLGLDPVPVAVCAFGARFDGAQWTFLKFKPEDLFALYGIEVDEMNVWRRPIEHIEDNAAAGMLSTVEVDSFWLPDTAGTGYREAHGKTTIVPVLVDRDREELQYFHNSGCHRLTGADFRGVFGLDEPEPPAWPPYVEQIRFRPGATLNVDAFDTALRRHLRARPRGNPVRDLAARVVADVEWLGAAGVDGFHRWSFGVLRQCGATAELAADVCGYMQNAGYPDAGGAIDDFRAVAEGAKAVQFRMARAARGRAVDPTEQLDAMADAWQRAMTVVAAAAGQAVPSRESGPA